MSQKVRCVTTDDTDLLTIGKVYDVLKIDADGDIWIEADNGNEFFMFPCECEFVTEEK